MDNPSNNPRSIILKVLEIINFLGDKEKFADDFITNIRLQSLLDLSRSLPEEKRGEFKAKIQNNQGDSAKIDPLLKEYFPAELINKSLEDTASNAIVEWLKAISGTLSDQQKGRLDSLSKEFQPVTQ